MSRFSTLPFLRFIPFSLLGQDEEADKPRPETVSIGGSSISLHNIHFYNKEYTTRFWLWMLHASIFLTIFAIWLVYCISFHYPDKRKRVAAQKVGCRGSRIVIPAFVVSHVILILLAV